MPSSGWEVWALVGASFEDFLDDAASGSCSFSAVAGEPSEASLAFWAAGAFSVASPSVVEDAFAFFAAESLGPDASFSGLAGPYHQQVSFGDLPALEPSEHEPCLVVVVASFQDLDLVDGDCFAALPFLSWPCDH